MNASDFVGLCDTQQVIAPFECRVPSGEFFSGITAPGARA